MGLKSGSRDSGLDEDEQDETHTEASEQTAQADTSEANDTGSSHGEGNNQVPAQTDEVTGAQSEESASQPAVESLPYKLRRPNVNDGREQVPYFLRPEIIDRENALKETLEAELGETVYKSDYREAAMVLAQRNPDLIADILREWGYDLDRR